MAQLVGEVVEEAEEKLDEEEGPSMVEASLYEHHSPESLIAYAGQLGLLGLLEELTPCYCHVCDAKEYWGTLMVMMRCWKLTLRKELQSESALYATPFVRNLFAWVLFDWVAWMVR